MKVLSVEPTPNPNALKFLVSDRLATTGVRQFDNSGAAENDPLAKPLFSLKGVDTIFYASQFVTVSKTSDVQWGDLQDQIIKQLETFDPAQLKSGPAESSSENASKPDLPKGELMDKINEVLDSNVRPPLENDGGGLEVISLDGYVLSIHYQGACGSCPSATQGTMMAIENLLRAMVDPRIQVVSA